MKFVEVGGTTFLLKLLRVGLLFYESPYRCKPKADGLNDVRLNLAKDVIFKCCFDRVLLLLLLLLNVGYFNLLEDELILLDILYFSILLLILMGETEAEFGEKLSPVLPTGESVSFRFNLVRSFGSNNEPCDTGFFMVIRYSTCPICYSC